MKRVDDTQITYTRMMEHIWDLAEEYECVSVSYIGESVLGRGIPMVTLGNTEAKKGVLYVGAHHGMEWLTSAVLLRFIEEYAEAYGRDCSMYGHSVTRMARERFTAVVPMLNPDGVELQINGVSEGCPMRDRLLRMSGGDFSRWQANGRGVDLNHNYDAGFSEYKVLERRAGIEGGCATRYSGEYPESEPETAALASLLRYDDRIELTLTLHSQGEEIYANDRSAPGCDRIGRMISKMSGYRFCDAEGMAMYGGLTDWVVSVLGRPCFTLECGRGENPLPMRELFSVYSRLREVFFALPQVI